MEFQVRYLALFLLFSVIDGSEWFWMGSLHKNIQLMLEIIKAPFLVLNLSYYTLMTFLMMSVILLSLLIYAICLLNSKCGQASDFWKQLELSSEPETDLQDTVDWSKKWLVDFSAGKTQLALLGRSNNTGSIDVKMDGRKHLLFLRKHLLRCWGWPSLLLKQPLWKLEPCSMKFLSGEVALYLYKSTINPCM